MAPLKLRTATAADEATLLNLMDAFYQIDQYPFNRTGISRSFRYLLENPHYGEVWLILDQQDQAIGYLVLTIGYSFEYGGKDGFIDEFFLLEAFRGKGLGKQILGFAIEQAARLGINTLHLEVEKHNLTGIHLYEKFGFEKSKRFLMNKPILPEAVSSR